MNDDKKQGGGLDKLASLLGQPGGNVTPIRTTPAPLADPDDEDALEAALLADVDDVLKLAAMKTEGNLFDMQVLVETAAQLIREQIREQVEGEE
jgi:hypothetical protein